MKNTPVEFFSSNEADWGAYMQEAARRAKQHRGKTRKAGRPKTGAFYWVPSRKGKGSDTQILWDIWSYFDSDGNSLHQHVWEVSVVPMLKEIWGPQMGRLSGHYSALPRGRVAIPLSKGYNIYHGNDAPMVESTAIRSIIREFSLPPLGAGTKWVFDDHEQVNPWDLSVLKELIPEDLGLKSPETDYDEDYDEDDDQRFVAGKV